MSKFIKQAGMPSMLKDGASVQNDPMLKNIQACKEMAQVTKTSFGPFGLNKMVVNHLGKLFVTHDAAVILRELEVQHPAANLLVMSSKAIEEEVGDGSNYTIMFAAELLSEAEGLRKKGLKPAEIIRGYQVALKKALEVLKANILGSIKDHRNAEEMMVPIKWAIAFQAVR
ncbi:T-complex protein 1 subunit theta, partial [Diplonema papillatum]